MEPWFSRIFLFYLCAVFLHYVYIEVIEFTHAKLIMYSLKIVL